jgi:hypothetical protein
MVVGCGVRWGTVARGSLPLFSRLVDHTLAMSQLDCSLKRAWFRAFFLLRKIRHRFNEKEIISISRIMPILWHE